MKEYSLFHETSEYNNSTHAVLEVRAGHIVLAPLGSQTIIIILIEKRASFHETFESQYNNSIYAAREARAAHVVLVPPLLRYAKNSFH